MIVLSTRFTISQKKAKASDAEEYRKRDEHETFLRPATKQAQKKRWERENKKSKSKKQKKDRGLTDKQRAAEAHAHFIVHHSTVTTTKTLLRSERAASLSAETIEQLKSMI